MLDEVVQQLLALNPRADTIRRDAAALYQQYAAPEIERIGLDVLFENLAILGVVFFHVRPSSTALVESILVNDCFFVAIVLVMMLDEHWSQSEQPAPDQMACLETIAALLSGIAEKSVQMRNSVKRELVAAFLVAAALRNARRGNPLLQDVREDVFREHELYLALQPSVNLRDVVEETRRRFFPLPSGA